MIQLLIKDYSYTDKIILFDILDDALKTYRNEIVCCDAFRIDNCDKCPGKKVCRDIQQAFTYLYHVMTFK